MDIITGSTSLAEPKEKFKVIGFKFSIKER